MIPPSSLGKAHTFQSRQKSSINGGPGICYFDRPPEASHHIPPTLIHPVFGHFLDDCETHTPTKKDNDLAYEMRMAMSGFYANEAKRLGKLREILEEEYLVVSPSQIDNCTTDGDLRVNGYRLLILEGKNEIGLGDAEPFLEAIGYYQRSVNEGGPGVRQSEIDINSSLPCLIVCVFGPNVGFAGAVFTDRPNVQILSSIVPLAFHPTDTKNQLKLARHVGAMKNAIGRLRTYYEEVPKLRQALEPHRRRPDFPYPSTFESLQDQQVYKFRYLWMVEAKLVFEAILESGESICIKFVRRYCKEAHEKCAEAGFSPRLRGFKRLPGDWIMVVMDYLDPDHYDVFKQSEQHLESLYKGMEKQLSRLHQAGFVHGDVRDVNMMLNREDGSKFMLLDFDWAGKIGEVRYPAYVNKAKELGRPEEVSDGGLVKAEHDMAMLKFMFKRM
ncbi:hypothetical protein AX15_006563 [Amanita polypyramis BW_CC]|nr:hypothetical protein AX15_006563 [Amanita polypyramis BW_CC]